MGGQKFLQLLQQVRGRRTGTGAAGTEFVLLIRADEISQLFTNVSTCKGTIIDILFDLSISAQQSLITT